MPRYAMVVVVEAPDATEAYEAVAAYDHDHADELVYGSEPVPVEAGVYWTGRAGRDRECVFVLHAEVD